MIENAAEQQKQLAALLEEYRDFRGATIPVLQRAQDIFGYLPKEVLLKISEELHIPISKIYGVVTFYAQFHLEPRGKHVIRACQGTACHVRGAKAVLEEIRHQLELTEDKRTTDDGMFTLETVACIGACALAPCVMVDDDTHGRLTPLTAVEMIEEYRS